MSLLVLAKTMLGIAVFPLVFAGVTIKTRIKRGIHKWYRTAETAETNTL